MELDEIRRGVGRGRRRVQGRVARTASFEVNLEDIEEGTGNERAQDEASSALDHALKRHNESHGGGSGGFSGCDRISVLGLGISQVDPPECGASGD